ncbi:hypothetical protein ZOSMA_9953G00020, partial [Zostera marina]
MPLGGAAKPSRTVSRRPAAMSLSTSQDL